MEAGTPGLAGHVRVGGMIWIEPGTRRVVGRTRPEAGKSSEAMAATVLVVEHQRKLRDFARSNLERAGFTVLSTGSGAEALEHGG